ncbi:profilin-4 isoform X2 [Conger conger]|uniref:profilin-4 isoform X2 n=1 Tax=Conger conger TaxID=82655 RepID=UPI002A59CA46|nr:profilin-4 isoform X2 [Conger conger]
MNQLQTLLTDCLINTKHVENAAVVTTKTATIPVPMMQMLIDSFHHTLTREEGIRFMGKNYTCVRADKNSIYCKSNEHGLILVKTAVYIIVATYNDSMYPSVCVEAVEKLGKVDNSNYFCMFICPYHVHSDSARRKLNQVNHTHQLQH